MTRLTSFFFLLSYFFQLSFFSSTTKNITTLTVTFPVDINNIQGVLVPQFRVQDVGDPLLLLVILNKSKVEDAVEIVQGKYHGIQVFVLQFNSYTT